MSHDESLNQKVNKLVSASNPDEVKSIYQDWSESYDEDLQGFGYVAPDRGVQLLLPLLSDKAAFIHDAGCGTGLVGNLLSRAGCTNLHGTDFSAAMLDKADATGCYQQLTAEDFGTTLSMTDNHFDAAISIGVYTKRFKHYFLSEMIRTIKPGGHCVFSCRELYFTEVMDTVSAMLVDKRVFNVNVQHLDYMTGQQASAYYLTLEKS